MSAVKSSDIHKQPPSQTLEGREKQLIDKAIRLAEKKIDDGTASNQIIVHYLKLATTREQKEKEILDLQMELMEAKTEAIRASERTEQLYKEAIEAFQRYSGVYDDKDL